MATRSGGIGVPVAMRRCGECGIGARQQRRKGRGRKAEERWQMTTGDALAAGTKTHTT